MSDLAAGTWGFGAFAFDMMAGLCQRGRPWSVRDAIASRRRFFQKSEHNRFSNGHFGPTHAHMFPLIRSFATKRAAKKAADPVVAAAVSVAPVPYQPVAVNPCIKIPKTCAVIGAPFCTEFSCGDSRPPLTISISMPPISSRRESHCHIQVITEDGLVILLFNPRISALGQPLVGVETGPRAIRDAGVLKRITKEGWRMQDLGDLQFGAPRSGMNENPHLRNSAAVGAACKLLADAAYSHATKGAVPLFLTSSSFF